MPSFFYAFSHTSHFLSRKARLCSAFHTPHIFTHYYVLVEKRAKKQYNCLKNKKNLVYVKKKYYFCRAFCKNQQK